MDVCVFGCVYVCVYVYDGRTSQARGRSTHCELRRAVRVVWMRVRFAAT